MLTEQVVPAHIAWEEAVSMGIELRESKDNSQWRLGDLALQINTVYGEDSIGTFANAIGINKKSLQQYRRVSDAFKPKQRIDLLSHRHHLILASRKDRQTWLKAAADNNWSTNQLHRELALADGKQLHDPEDKPAVSRCPDCGKWRLETDEKCVCVKWRTFTS